jgi:putative SOS response-associated peptidase YedK
LPPLPAIYPDFMAPIIRNNGERRELVNVRWGLPTSSRALFEAARKRAAKFEAKKSTPLTPEEFTDLLRQEPDRGTTNVRNVDSAHWRRWLDPRFRCVVPFTSFSEFSSAAGGDVWFAFDADRPLAFFAGIWAPQWTSVRKVKEGAVTVDLFAFLTTTPNAEVGLIHSKAMPVILRTPEEIETWMTAPWEVEQQLHRPQPDGVLQVIARGVKQDYPST